MNYEEFKRFAEKKENSFTEEERNNVKNLIMQYEEAITKYNIE